MRKLIVIPPGRHNEIFPAWSPDGKKIAFESNRDTHDGNYEIYVMNADGSNQTRLTNNKAFDMQPTWSPDGKKIIFVLLHYAGGPDQIYLMNADGSNQTNLSNNQSINSFPVLSP